MTPTHALSIRQPWASLIVQGAKDVENRTWAPRRRIPFRMYVHAALRRDGLSVPDQEWILDRLDPKQRHRYLDAVQPLGAIIGEVSVIGIARDTVNAESPWYESGIGWMLDDAIAYTEWPRVTGQLGLFKVPAWVREATWGKESDDGNQ